VANETKPTETPAADPVEVASDKRAQPTAPGSPEHAHPTEVLYIKIALILALVTAAEVGVYYIEGIKGNTLIAILLAMAVVKFALVGLFFMHLRFDSPLLRRLFITGIALAIFVYVVALSTFEVWNR
jgi:cytochrome c oxidase subunit IV